MFTPLKNHLIELKNLIQSYRAQLTNPRVSTPQRVELHKKLQLGRKALQMYISAYEIESSLRNEPQPSLGPFLVEKNKKRVTECKPVSAPRRDARSGVLRAPSSARRMTSPTADTSPSADISRQQ